MELIDDVTVHPVALLSALRVVLPSSEDTSEPEVVACLLVELVHAALLGVVLFVELADRALLLLDALHHL